MSVRHFTLTLAALLLMPGAALANHVDFIQDDSDTSNGTTNATFLLSSSAPANTVTDTQVGEPADILGGQRIVTLVRDGGFIGSVTAEKAAGTDFIDFRSGNTAAGTLTLDYNAFDNVDFTTMWDRIDVAIPLLDTSSGVGDGQFDAFLSVESSAGNGTVGSGRIKNSVTGGSAILSFSFDDPGFSGVNFADVDRVTLTVQTKIIGTVFQVGSITREANVPEPTSLALFGLGTIALVGLRRSRS